MEKSITISGLTENMKMLRGVSDFLASTTPMKKCVARVRDTIIVKTSTGHDYRGKRFAPYSEGYAKRKGVPKSHVTLRQTGTMLDQLKDQVIDANHGRVSVEGSMNVIAGLHTKGGLKEGRPPQREFLNITDNAIKVIAKEEWDDQLMKIMGRR